MPKIMKTAEWFKRGAMPAGWASGSTTDTTTATFTSVSKGISKSLWGQEIKYMSRHLDNVKLVDGSVAVPEQPKVKISRKKAREKEVPLGARQPNIHANEVSWDGSIQLRHAWCRPGWVVSRFDCSRQALPEYGASVELVTKGKPFCLHCKRFLSRRAIQTLNDLESSKEYVKRIEPTENLGIVVAYIRKGGDDEAFEEPPLAEDGEAF